MTLLMTKVEEALGLKRQQENFIDMISHEIRNPLSAVLHCADEIARSLRTVLSETGLTHTSSIKGHLEDALEADQAILFCVQHQRRLVDDISTLSKLDSDLVRLNPIPVQPVEIKRQAVSVFDKELKAASIDLEIDESRSLVDLKLSWTLLDPSRHLQILLNLVTNAIKFTRSCKERKIRILISATEERPSSKSGLVEYFSQDCNKEKAVDQHEHTYLTVAVQDTGIGITKSDIGALFNRFSQASPKTSSTYGGTGLGLSISRQITEMMGGEIGVASTPGKGSTFAFFVIAPRVELSASRQAQAKYKQEATVKSLAEHSSTFTDVQQQNTTASVADVRSKTKTSSPPAKSLHILVVEDNVINQRILCKQLRARGHSVEAANHGKEALSALQATPLLTRSQPIEGKKSFHVVLCDIEMPVMNGIDFVKEVRKLEGEGALNARSNIIAVTANARSGQVERIIEAGMDGVTTKPYHMDELMAEIDRVYQSSIAPPISP